MSLQNLATQMAAQGRGPDRTLVHMSPKEVQGLQALAMAHGGSLTINPETGLPEAGFLENILPAVAGFALNAFLPGVGTAVGGLFGLGEAAGTALTVGGISGLASGSLEKGIMAGMGAYGGASIGESMIKGGASSLTPTNSGEYGGWGSRDAGGDTGPMSTADRLGALKTGASSAFNSPKDFLKDNKLALAAISAPVLMDTFGNKTELPAAQQTKKYNMHYEKDPVTGALYDTSGEGVTYGGVGRSTRGMAEGGIVDYDTRTDSQKALDYLMGKPGAKNPMLFTHQTASEAIKPADFATRAGGKYILDAATNTYTWVPDGSTATKAGLPALIDTSGPGGGSELGATGNNTSGLNPGGVNTNKGIVSSILSSTLMGKIANALGSKQDPTNVTVEDRTGTSVSAANAAAAGLSALGANSQQAANNMSQNAQNAVATGSNVTDPAQAAQAAQAASAAAIGDMAESEGVALGPAASGGGGGGGGPGGCFLTTAAVSHMKQKDNGEVLNTLREFRDTYMRKNKEKSKDIAWYYKNAPRIVAALDKRPDADKVYKKMYSDFIKPAYNAIQKGDDAHAYEIYKDGIDFAKKHSGIDKEDLTPRYGPRGMASGGIANFAGGGLGSLGGYSDGGQLLRGPGDGVSDSIPARIGRNQPARLADGEFVIPARIVSELGNGSTNAGAKQLYKMLDRIQANRKKTVGKNKTATDSKSARYLPA